MSSPDLVELGDFLYDEVGDVTLSDLAADSRLNAQVSEVIARITDFIVPESETAEERTSEGDAGSA